MKKVVGVFFFFYIEAAAPEKPEKRDLSCSRAREVPPKRVSKSRCWSKLDQTPRKPKGGQSKVTPLVSKTHSRVLTGTKRCGPFEAVKKEFWFGCLVD